MYTGRGRMFAKDGPLSDCPPLHSLLMCLANFDVPSHLINFKSQQMS
jgi:hypothetical protein